MTGVRNDRSRCIAALAAWVLFRIPNVIFPWEFLLVVPLQLHVLAAPLPEILANSFLVPEFHLNSQSCSTADLQGFLQENPQSNQTIHPFFSPKNQSLN